MQIVFLLKFSHFQKKIVVAQREGLAGCDTAQKMPCHHQSLIYRSLSFKRKKGWKNSIVLISLLCKRQVLNCIGLPPQAGTGFCLVTDPISRWFHPEKKDTLA